VSPRLIVALAFAVVAVALAPLVAVRADDPPRVAVYSFTMNGSATGSAGSDFADAVADELRTAGGVDVIRGAPTVSAAQARADAKSKGADYFVIGGIEPLGTAYSVITQLCRTRTGLLMWSAPIQATSAASLVGQGRQIHDVVLEDVQRSSLPTLASAPAVAPAATPTPPSDPAADASNLPLSKPAVPPGSAFDVLVLGGSAQAGDRTYAARAAAEGIRHHGPTAAVVAMQPNTEASAPDTCASSGAANVVGGLLDVLRSPNMTATTATVTLTVYDCRTHEPFAKPLNATASAAISTDAIRSAVDAALNAYFGSPEPHA
jgi:hypothetical protein